MRGSHIETTPQFNFSESRWFKGRLWAYYLWYYQNYLLIIVGCLIIPNIAFTIFLPLIGRSIGSIVNIFCFFALLFDIIIIFILSLSFLADAYFMNGQKNALLPKLLLGTIGLLWVVITGFWRLPYYVQPPLDLGFGFTQISQSSLVFYQEVGENNSLLFSLLCSAILLLLFLWIQDHLLLADKSQSLLKSFKIGLKPNLGFIYGLSNVISSSLIIMLGYILLEWNSIPEPKPEPSPSLQWLTLAIVVAKLIITPIIGRKTAVKLITCTDPGRYYTDTQDFTIPWYKPCLSIKVRIPKNIKKGIYLCVLAILIIPISPFFFWNLLPHPFVEGPYITRTYHTAEAELVLQYCEQIDIEKLSNFSLNSPYMTNTTLNTYIAKITEAKNRISIFGNYHYKFEWNVSVESVESETLNQTAIQSYWPTRYGYLIWWENNTSNINEDLNLLSESPFANFSQSFQWLFQGSFQYFTIAGPLGAYWLDVDQIMFIDQHLNILGLIFYQTIVVS